MVNRDECVGQHLVNTWSTPVTGTWAACWTFQASSTVLQWRVQPSVTSRFVHYLDSCWCRTCTPAQAVRVCRDLVDAMLGEMLQFDLRNGALRKKYDGLKYTLKKLENVLYELSLLQGGVTRKDEGEVGAAFASIHMLHSCAHRRATSRQRNEAAEYRTILFFSN